MSTSQRSARAVVTVVAVNSVNSSSTGHVVLGVLGSIAFVFFLVVIVVPLIRWRKRHASSPTQSRTSSRRTHTRIVSEYHQDVVAPLLEEQPHGMTANESAPMVSQIPQPAPSRPPSALLNRKILQTLPNFDDGSSDSSLGKPLDSKERIFPEGESGVRIVDADRRSGSLPPIPVSEGPSRESTLVAQMTQSSPLVGALQRPASLGTLDTPSSASSIGGFRFPSLVSSSSRSSVPSLDSQGSPQLTQNSTLSTHTPWLPKSLVLNPEGVTASETWWRIPSMPPIPESVHSGSISSIHQVIETKKDASPPIARLLDASATVGPSKVHHVREVSGSAPTQSSLSRSSTQHTEVSNKSSLADRDERRISTMTHGTFGRQGRAESRDPSSARPSPSDEGGLDTLVPSKKPNDLTLKRVKRRTFDYPPEPSPPLEPAPLSAPPPLHSLRPVYPSRLTRPSSQPVPDPQSPQDAELEGESAPYGYNREASSSDEHLIALSVSSPLLPELPSLPQLTPLSFEFKLDSAPASRSNSLSTGRRSRKSNASQSKAKGHSKTPSKASTASAWSSGAGSKRSLRSLASFGSRRSGSSHSRSKSQERTKHSRRVTFGDEQPTSSPPVNAIDGPSVPEEVVQSQPIRPPRPLPSLPATIITSYITPSPGQGSSTSLRGRG